MSISSPLARSVTFLFLVLSVAAALPLVALSFYNHPSPTDDYCFANTSIHYGFWQSQQIYYNGWSGRFFHNFLVHGSPLIFGWYDGYKIYPIVLLVLLMLAFYAFSSQWLHDSFDRTTKIGLAAALFVSFITTLASVPEYMYWYAGMACYSLSTVFLLFLLATLLIHQRRGFSWQSGYLLLESFFLVCIIGSSETGMVMAMSVLAMIAFGEFLLRHKLSLTILILLLVGAISSYYLVTAPGNAIRMSGNPNSANIPLTVLSSLRFSVGYFTRQLFSTPLLPLSLLYIPIAYQLTAKRPLPAYLRIHPLLGIAHGLATVFTLISLHFYGVGVAPAFRLINIINLVFWLSWGYNLTLLVIAFRTRLNPAFWTKYALPIVAVSLFLTGLSAVFGPEISLTYGDWLSGRAKQYDMAMQDRYKLMAQSGDASVLVAPLPVYPASMFIEDIKNNPQHLWNRCWADYYHKKAIVLKDSL